MGGTPGAGSVLTSHVVDVKLLPALLLVQPRLNDLCRVWKESERLIMRLLSNVFFNGVSVSGG